MFVLELVFPVIWQRCSNVVNSCHMILQVVISSVLSIADLTFVLDLQVSISVVSLELIPPVSSVVTVVTLHSDALMNHPDVSIKKEFPLETFLTLITVKQDLLMHTSNVRPQVRLLTAFEVTLVALE